MKSFKKFLTIQKEKYFNLLNIINKEIKRVYDEGSLEIRKTNSSIQYYQVKYKNNNKEVKYISKNNTELIKSLAEKSYLPKLKKLVTKRLKQLNDILKDYSDTEIDDTYENLNPNRKELISPVVPTAKQNLEINPVFG